MSKNKLLQILLGCGLFLVITCSSEEITSLSVGEDFTNTNIRVLSIDTFTVKLSTMKFDSLAASGQGRLFIGQYTDEYVGKVTSSSYFRIKPSTYYLDDDAVLDSVGLFLSYDEYFYNDTTQVSNINIYKLNEKIKDEEDGYIYNSRTFEHESTPLATKSFEARPYQDSLYVTLDYDFGLELFSDIQNNLITDEESLYQKLKGLTVQPGTEDNSAIVGFNTSDVYMRFFYTIPSELESEELTYDFIMDTEDTAYFNHIESEVTGLPIENIISSEYNLESSESNNITYNQPGVGYVTRIQFPTIKNIYNINDEGTILDATLYIEPVPTTYSSIQTIPESLELYTVDPNNDLSSQVSGSSDYIYATFETDESEYNHEIYSMSVLAYLDQKLNEQPEIDDALILIPSDYNSSVNKLLFNDSEASNYRTKLIITYAIYEKN
tara:strand:+ start:2588 stop:3898 length:1311 start_codon:yes stop_codon:yes gene_type:complete